MVTAADGVEVPVSLVYRRERFAKNSTNPLYVYGYGSYGYALPVSFSGARLSLLDRGLVMAYAHIRGGGDLGDPWHDAGKMMRQAHHLHRLHPAVEHLSAAGLRRPHPRRHRGRQRRRPAHGRRRQPAPRPLPRRALPRSLRRRHEHHARRHAPPHRRRVRRVGQSQRARSLRLHAELLSLRQPQARQVTPPC
jgi:hypothetical protein